MVGLAVGDALGAPVEFESPAQIAGRRDELFAMPGGGGFGWAPGEFTDDTQMALVLARHLRVRGGAIDGDALASEFAEWEQDAADVGIQTRTVLDAVRRGTPWRDAVATLPPDAAGNGSLMRTAPVALAASSSEAAKQVGRDQSSVTHPAQSCLDACGVFSALLWEVFEGRWPSLQEGAIWATTDEVRRAVLDAALVSRPTMSGWVLHTLTGALWSVYGAESFADAVWRAVALGHDADTVAAVAGALAGAHWGLAGIPPNLPTRLTSKHPLFIDTYPEALTDLADALVDGRAPD